jgi:hypothetical protein
MSRYSTIIDAIASDLYTNVTTLSTANSANQLKVHKYTPLSIERLQRDGYKHLAVWLSPQAPAVQRDTDGTSTGQHQHVARYEVLYWEASPEGESGVADETSAATILTLADDITTRLYQSSFQTVGSSAGVWRMWFESFTPLIGGGEGVRALNFTLQGVVSQDFA